MNSSLLIPLMVGATTCILVLVAAFAWDSGFGKTISPSRIDRVAHRNRNGEQRALQPASQVRRQERPSLLGPLGRVLGSIIPTSASMSKILRRAGLGLTPIDFLAGCAALGMLCFIALRFFADLSLITGIGISGVVGTMIPRFLLKRKIRLRERAFVKHFPEAIDLIVRSVKSGLPVTDAIRSIAVDMPAPIGDIFRDIVDSLQIGVPLNEALWNAARRESIPELKFFVITLSIQQETGGNISEILQNLSHMIRRREQMQLKIKAMSSEARASAMIIGSLPIVMMTIIYFVNNEYIMILFTDSRGNIALGIGLFNMFLGAVIISNMIKFEI